MTSARQPRGTGFALRDPLPWESFARLAREGESMGYRAVFLPEIGARDAFAALTGLAGETRDLLLGTGVVPMTSRVPRLTAMGAATVQERSGGRMILGLGTGPAQPGSLDALETQIRELRALLGDTEGPGAALSLSRFEPVPIWISALGPRAVSMAGRVADGVLLNWCTPERVTQARMSVRAAAEEAGRDADSVTIAVYVRAAVDEDPEPSLSASKRAVGEYASYPAYARQFERMGLGRDAEAAAAAHEDGRPQDIGDEFVRRICVVGGRAQARRRLRAYHDAGADLVVVYPMLTDGEPSLAHTLRSLAPKP